MQQRVARENPMREFLVHQVFPEIADPENHFMEKGDADDQQCDDKDNGRERAFLFDAPCFLIRFFCLF
jgi:hypothetical protein